MEVVKFLDPARTLGEVKIGQDLDKRQHRRKPGSEAANESIAVALVAVATAEKVFPVLSDRQFFMNAFA